MTDEHPFYRTSGAAGSTLPERVMGLPGLRPTGTAAVASTGAAAGWTPARMLRPGDRVRGDAGELQVLANGDEAHPQGVTVYNLEVEADHTYFVLAERAADDADAAWVHNATYTTKRMRRSVNELDEQGYRWYRDPFTNRMKRTRLKMAADHILPSDQIERLRGYNLLTPAQQRLLKTDMRNVQALPVRLNSSKGARTSQDLTEMLGRNVSSAYIRWLSRREATIRKHLQFTIDTMLKGE